MADVPDNLNPVHHVKGLAGKLKGLPTWVWIAGGVGAAGIAYTVHRNSVAATASDTTGTDSTDGDAGALSATTAGDAYPVGSQGADYYDPGTGDQAIDPSTFTDAIISGLAPYITGGGTQASATPDDHYTPPAITVNVPASATPVPQTQAAAAAPATGGCPAAYPHYNAANGAPGPKSCYTDTVQTNVCHGGKKSTAHIHKYQDGSSQAISWDVTGGKC